MSATKQFSLTDEEITAILRALRVRINDLHRLADNLDASDDPSAEAGSRFVDPSR
jgi:hypothetical protein